MTRYHVADAGTLESLRQAINATISRTGTRVVNGVAIPVNLAAEEARLGIEPEQLVHTSRLLIAGSDAALELPETTHVEAALPSVLTPQQRSTLVQVARPRQNDRLPAGVMRILDRRFLATVPELDDVEVEALDDVEALPVSKRQALVAAVGEVTAARLRAAFIARKAERQAAAIERAIGGNPG